MVDMNRKNESWPSGLSSREILGWCLAFVGTAAFANRILTSSPLKSPELIFVGLAIFIVVLIAIAFMVRSARQSSATDFDWGVPLDRDGWLTWASLVALTAVLAFVYPPVLPSLHHMTIFLFVALSFFTMEIVLRAFVIRYLVSLWGSSGKQVFLAIVVTAFLITLAQSDLRFSDQERSFMSMAVVNVLLGYLYYYGRSILPYLYFVVVAGVNQVLPSTTNGEMTFIFATELVLYLAFGLLARRLTSDASNELEPAMSRSG